MKKCKCCNAVADVKRILIPKKFFLCLACLEDFKKSYEAKRLESILVEYFRQTKILKEKT